MTCDRVEFPIHRPEFQRADAHGLLRPRSRGQGQRKQQADDVTIAVYKRIYSDCGVFRYNDAMATIRRVPSVDHNFQLVITRVYEDGDQELLEDEDESV